MGNLLLAYCSSFTNLSLPNKVTKLTIVNLLIVRNSNQKKLTTIQNNKMVCNKIALVFVLVGLISVSSMVSSAAVGAETTSAKPTEPPATTTPAATTSIVTEKNPTSTPDKDDTTQKDDSSSTTQKVDPSATTPTVDPSATTTPNGNGAGCPKITYGMLFSVISAILLFSA